MNDRRVVEAELARAGFDWLVGVGVGGAENPPKWTAAEIHSEVGLIAYNLACYACILGDISETKELLLRAFAMDDGFKKLALDDPDLDPIFGPIKNLP